MRHGRCLCGAVSFDAVDTRTDFGLCHCKMCQRWTGSAFPGLTVPAEQLTISGHEHIGIYRSSPMSTRSFCKICGSTLWFRDVAEGALDQDPEAGAYEIALGLLDDTEGLVLQHEIFIDRRLPSMELAGVHGRQTEAEYFARKGMTPPKEYRYDEI